MAKHFASLRPYALDIVEQSMGYMDRYWDEAAGLLAMPSYERLSDLPVVHHIRETSWYALGLLQRGSDADRQRACAALQSILTYQFDEPGQPYDGTWYRFPEEPHPGTRGIWRGYDPNWREFIGTTLAIILLDYEQDLPRTLVQGIDAALRKAIRGTLTRDLGCPPAVPASQRQRSAERGPEVASGLPDANQVVGRNRRFRSDERWQK